MEHICGIEYRDVGTTIQSSQFSWAGPRFQNQVVSIPASYSEFLASSLSLFRVLWFFSSPFMVATWDLFEMYVEIECWAFWTLGCDVLLGEWFLTFQRNIMHLPSESRSPRRTSLNFLTLERESIVFLWNVRIYSANDTVTSLKKWIISSIAVRTVNFVIWVLFVIFRIL